MRAVAVAAGLTFAMAVAVLAAPPPAQALAHLTTGRMKHAIFVKLRHDPFWQSRYDEGRVHGPIFKSCYVYARTRGTCLFELGIGSKYAWGYGDVHLFRRRDGVWTNTTGQWFWGRY